MDTKYNEEIVKLLCKFENIDSVFAILDNDSNIKNYLINKVFLPQLTSMCKEIGLNNTAEEYDRVNTSWAGFYITNPSWKYFDFLFEFEALGLRKFIIGIAYKSEDNRNDKTYEKLKTFFNKGDKNRNVWDFFPTYTDWGKDAMKAIIDGTMIEAFKVEILKILELTKDLKM